MSESFTGTQLLLRAYRFAKLLTGSDKGALTGIRSAAQDVLSHPAAGDPGQVERLFFAAVRKRCLRIPANCELTDEYATLHAMPEPGRSLCALQLTGGLAADDLHAVLGSNGRAEQPEVLSPAMAQDLSLLDPDAHGREELAKISSKMADHAQGGAFRVRNPATVAVGFGFLLLIGVLIWQMTGKIGVFPEEALKIAAEARRASFEQFSAVEAQAANIPDWFAMQGLDGVVIPPALADYDVVGVRTFKIDGVSVAQAAAIDGEKNLFFLSFEAEPLGIRISPLETWRIVTSGSSVLAIRQDSTMCFLVAFEGTAEEMEAILLEEQTTPSA